jgi:hypothetical protein
LDPYNRTYRQLIVILPSSDFDYGTYPKKWKDALYQSLTQEENVRVAILKQAVDLTFYSQEQLEATYSLLHEYDKDNDYFSLSDLSVAIQRSK